MENLTKSFGDLVLFENISFGLSEGQRVGLIAKNGSGKSTLLNILSGKEGYDGGTISFRRDIRVGYLEQDPQYPEELTVLEACFHHGNSTVELIKEYERCMETEGHPGLDEILVRMDHEKAWEYEQKAKQILSQLKIRDFNQQVKSLSGGQLKRVALANTLITEPDLLILDEPTNHLDLDMTEWLEDYLRRTNLTLLMVTHDRYFLDRVCSEIIEIDNRRIYDMKSLAKALSSGSLRGARGHSGVILSQLFRGFTKVIAEYDEIDVQVLSDAFEKAVETAYKAVMKPKEGTILTVAKGMAVRAVELSEEETTDLLAFCEEVIKEGDHVLSMTPDMLPVLKQAGVVDSGGQGLMQVMKGALDSLQGKEIDYSIETPEKQPAAETGSASYNIDAQAAQEIKFAYCTQFLIMLEKPISTRQETEFKEYLESIGDSIVVVADDEIVKVHVHTNDPGLAMQRGLTYGSLTTIIIENMKLERDEKISALKEKEMQSETIEDVEKQLKGEEAPKEQEPPKEMGFISVSIGDGINEIFQGLGVDYIIEGGQTMNPSTEDMLNAIEKVNAKNIFILPNNKNIILAANQAASLVEDKKIIVIPTKTIPQGITALINYIPDSTPEENAERMSEELGTVKTGQVTYAVRDTVIDDKEIKQDDFMGIGDQGILSVGKELETTVLDMIEQLIDEDSAIVSIYYGEDAREDAANAIGEKITEAHPDVEVEVHYGGQPIYYYVISVE